MYFQLIRIYAQCVHNVLEVMQGRHLGGDWKGLRPFNNLRFLFFSCKSYLWNSVTAAKTIRYADSDPKDHWYSQRFTEIIYKKTASNSFNVV